VSASTSPLAGVTVLDFTRILSGPYCTLLLADQGAEVIKVEAPDGGDDTRRWGPPFLADGSSAYFAALNRGKKSIVVDLRLPAGRARIHALVRRVDVVVENFRPGVAERLGIDFSTLSGLNPRLVVCSISGYGLDSGYSHLPGTEIIIEAMSGAMHVTGDPDGEPVRFGPAMIDIATGLTAATKITAALLRARETGEGAHVTSSLYATALASLSTLITSYGVDGVEPRRWGSHHPSIAPYGGFPTADGNLVTGAINDRTWTTFVAVLGLEVEAGWATNPGRVADRDRLNERIAAITRTRTTGEWVDLLNEHGLLVAPIRTVGQAVDDPVTQSMNLLVPLDGESTVSAPRLDGEPAGDGTPQHVPAIGEHTDEILGGLAGTFSGTSSSDLPESPRP